LAQGNESLTLRDRVGTRHAGDMASSMLRKFLGKTDATSASTPSETLLRSEECPATRLARCWASLLQEDTGRLDTRSEAGFDRCYACLMALDAAASNLGVQVAPRSYRAAFSINYRALFPSEERIYRVDVLEASIDRDSAIWVNGDKFEFSDEAMGRAEVLQSAWAALGELLLVRWLAGPLSRAQLQDALQQLDIAWASFEEKYIGELIAIEERARRLVVAAIGHDVRLQAREALQDEAILLTDPAYKQELVLLVGALARLNSVANVRRKGRDDLSAMVLLGAMGALQRCKQAFRAGQSGGAVDNIVSADGGAAEALEAARILAMDVVESFRAMRNYLRQVSSCLERVDPHLGNNAGLVDRLVDLEESWEVGARYVQNKQLFIDVCALVAELRAAQRLVPDFARMCDECSAELFMVLPRLIWLRFLAAPAAHMELVASLLPHRFPRASQTAAWDAEIDGLVCRFRQAEQHFAEIALAPQGWDTEAILRSGYAYLIRRAVAGAGELERQGSAGTGLPAAARTAVEELMREIERWSIELQRHFPEDWNQCSAVLLRCLEGARGDGSEAQERRRAGFTV